MSNKINHLIYSILTIFHAIFISIGIIIPYFIYSGSIDKTLFNVRVNNPTLIIVISLIVESIILIVLLNFSKDSKEEKKNLNYNDFNTLISIVVIITSIIVFTVYEFVWKAIIIGTNCIEIV